MTPREFFALKRVWGESKASFFNAHFRGPDEPAFIAEDFIDPIGRLERKAQLMRDKAEVARENARINMMSADSTDAVPLAFREIGVN